MSINRIITICGLSLAWVCCRAPGPKADAVSRVDAGRIAALVAQCNDRRAEVRDAAAQRLISLHTDAANDALVNAALQNWGIGAGGPGPRWLSQAGPAIFAAMARVFPTLGDWRERLALLGYVERAHDRAGEPLIRLALTDADADVVDVAVLEVGELPLTNAFEVLISFLRHPRPGRRDSAIHGLEALGDRRAVRPLVQILREPDVTPKTDHDYENEGQPWTLHDSARAAIDRLTGERLGGDVRKIEYWLTQHQS